MREKKTLAKLKGYNRYKLVIIMFMLALGRQLRDVRF